MQLRIWKDTNELVDYVEKVLTLEGCVLNPVKWGGGWVIPGHFSARNSVRSGGKPDSACSEYFAHLDWERSMGINENNYDDGCNNTSSDQTATFGLSPPDWDK